MDLLIDLRDVRCVEILHTQDWLEYPCWTAVAVQWWGGRLMEMGTSWGTGFHVERPPAMGHLLKIPVSA